MKIKYAIKRKLEDVERFFRRNIFRITHGYNYEDCWNLDHAAAKWLLPRLRHMRKNHYGYPGMITNEEWEEILDKMILAFELIIEDDSWGDTEKENAIDEGLDLFREYFRALWD